MCTVNPTHPPCVYILATRPHPGTTGPLYVGVTSNLPERIAQHRAAPLTAHARRYNIHTLVWAETHDTMDGAIAREKAIKKWRRQWKINLIEESNPNWKELRPD